MDLVEQIKGFARRRGQELRELAGSELTVEAVEASVGGQTVRFLANVERRAAWSLHVELGTRVATESLGHDEGLLREALSSLHAIFGVTREILKQAGPGVAMAEESLGRYAMAVLNRCLRPFLSKWHPQLADWEEQREPQTSRSQHERAWEHAAAMRQELERLRQILVGYSDALAILAGIDDGEEG